MASTIQNVQLTTIKGAPATLSDYRGSVLLIVNVASKCGLTPQYEALERIYRTYKDKGLVVLAFPANDFLEQEPGTDQEIAEFCSSTYDVNFPLFAKIAVTGERQHPLYRELIAAKPDSSGKPEEFRERLVGYGITTNPAPGVLWNFEKFLIGRAGKVVERFAPSVEPDDQMLVDAIERELAKSGETV